MTENLTQVVESRLRTQSFSETNGAIVEKTVEKACRENSTCNRKWNQQQLNHMVAIS